MKYAQGGKFHIRKPALAMARSNGSHTVAPDPITAKQSAPIRQTLIALQAGDAIHDSYTNSQTRNTKTSRSPTTPRSITPRGVGQRRQSAIRTKEAPGQAHARENCR